jgi:hypothetical protein
VLYHRTKNPLLTGLPAIFFYTILDAIINLLTLLDYEKESISKIADR